jgi:hypothetical protein
VFKVDLKLNGRSVRPGQLGRELTKQLEKEITNEVQDSVRKTVSRIRYRKHGGTARVVVKNRSLDSLNFDVSGCCDELIQEVKRALKH